jgi:hypothetical protein
MRRSVLGVAAVLALVGPGHEIDSGQTPAAISVLDSSTMDELPVRQISDLLTAVPSVQSYRYGDDPTGAPTLNRDSVPAATPDLLGVALITPGTTGYGDLEFAVKTAGISYGQSGLGLVDTKDYALFVSSRAADLGGPIVSDKTLWVQTDFTIGWDSLPGWKALDQYPGDTWQGASLALTAQYQPDKPLNFSLSDTANGFASVPFDGFYARGDSWTIAAVDLETIEGYGGPGWKYGFASHIHDGGYGSCPTCASIVTTYPAVPRMSSDLFSLAPMPWVSMTPQVASEPAGSTPGSIAELDDGWSRCWYWFFGGVAVVGLGLGAWCWDSRRRERPFLPAMLTRGLVDRVQGKEPTPRTCEPLRVRWKAAERTRREREKLVDSAKSFLDARVARVSELRAARASYQNALDGPRGGTGGNDFATIDGQLIKYDDLMGLAAGIDAQIADAEQSVNDAKVTVDERLVTLTEAEKAERAAKKAFDDCVASSTS